METALGYALTYISATSPSTQIDPASVTILADNDYYSQPAETSSAQPGGSRFLDFGVRLQDAHKTGLGSSAALVTAFTGAILSHYLPTSLFDINSPQDQTKLHNLAQAAHCAAQGKVGSGFDVAAAVYGTCVYRRFSPSILASIGEPGSPSFSSRVQQVVDNPSLWDTEVKANAVTIPEGMALVMCDVDCGSQTVGMVKQVLEWKKKDPEGSKQLWDQLQIENERLASKLSGGSQEEIRDLFSSIRACIRDMGKGSGVPIEPPEQTELLDAVTNDVDGVYGGVVPGAGGFDAVALLIRDDKSTLESLAHFLERWSVAKSSNVKLLGVKGEMEGARTEDKAKYQEWLK